MRGIGYTLQHSTLLRAPKSEIYRTVMTFLGIMKDCLIYVEQPVGDRMPMPTRRSSSSLKQPSWVRGTGRVRR